MSKKANPAAVGAFTFGALALMIFIILLFGSDQLMKKSVDCVLYFNGSLAGLDVGAPVVFRGVKIGAVKDIKLVYDRKQDDFKIPVIIEVYKGSATQVNGEPIVHAEHIQELIDKGMRAKLVSQSLLTGKLNVCLDFNTNAPVTLVSDSTGLSQIPTLPTTLEALANKIAELPLEDIVNDLSKSMSAISTILNATETRDLVKNMNNTTMKANESLNSVTETLKRIEELMDANSALRYDIVQAIKAAKEAANNVSELTSAIERQPESIIRGRTQKEKYK